MNGFPLRVGESIIPLFISIPRRKPLPGDEPQRPLRWIDTQSPVIQKRFKDLAYFIQHHASYNDPTTVPSRAKGKRPDRQLQEGFKPLQVLVQPERGLYRRDGGFIENDDALLFYDIDHLPLGREREAYQKLLPLMAQGRAFVWLNAIFHPKAAFWVRLRGTEATPEALLTRIHQEVFQGDPVFAPARGASDMWKSFVHTAEILEGMRVFFDTAYRRHVQTIHDAALARAQAWQEQHQKEMAEATAPDDRVEEGLTPAEGAPQPVIDAEPTSALSGFAQYLSEMDLSQGIPDAFDEYLIREFGSRLDLRLQFPLYEEPLPASLFGRKPSRFQELVIRFALSMPGRLLGTGVGIPSTTLAKLAHQFYPEEFKLRFDEAGALDSSSASKAIRELVKRGILEVADHRFRPGSLSKTYRALHPELIRLAEIRLGSTPGRRFLDRTVDDVDTRWEELTGQSLANTQIDGIRDQVVYRLTNLCPSFEVFEAAALRIPGMRQSAERMRFLPSQWKAHLDRDQRRTASAEADES